MKPLKKIVYSYQMTQLAALLQPFNSPSQKPWGRVLLTLEYAYVAVSPWDHYLSLWVPSEVAQLLSRWVPTHQGLIQPPKIRPGVLFMGNMGSSEKRCSLWHLIFGFFCSMETPKLSLYEGSRLDFVDLSTSCSFLQIQLTSYFKVN